jgi:hypothetical protein
MLYRSKDERVLCPDDAIAARSGIPDLTMFRTAVRLKPRNNFTSIPAFLQVVFHGLSKRLTLSVPLFILFPSYSHLDKTLFLGFCPLSI